MNIEMMQDRMAYDEIEFVLRERRLENIRNKELNSISDPSDFCTPIRNFNLLWRDIYSSDASTQLGQLGADLTLSATKIQNLFF